MLKAANDRLCLPYALATLADHLDYQLLLAREKNGLGQSARSFLEADDMEIVSQQINVPLFELPNLHAGLRRAFPKWQIEQEQAVDSSGSWGLGHSSYGLFTIRQRRQRSYLTEGSLYFNLPEGDRRIASFSVNRRFAREVPDIAFRLTGRRKRSRRVAAEMRHLIRWTRRHSYLRRQTIRPDGRLLDKSAPTAWDDIALPEATKELLQRNIVDMTTNRQLFRRNRVPQHRGILLHGAPGTGKTMIGKVLAGLGIATFIWVTAADIDGNTGRVRDVFQLARQLRPTILFLEDLDFHAAERTRHGGNGVLGELLTQMDGLEGNDGVIVVATTNDLAAIEPAIKDRPSRFDVVIEIGLPKPCARRQILANQLRHAGLEQRLLDDATVATNGLSGAQVREVAILTLQEAIFRRAVNEDGIARPTDDDIQAAIAKVTGKPRKPIGFASGASALLDRGLVD